MLSEHIAHASSSPLPSNRSFGFLFAFVGLAVGAWPYVGSLITCGKVRHDFSESCLSSLQTVPPNVPSLAIGVVFLLAALAYPKVLSPFNRLWMAFGNLLHVAVSSLILGILFFRVITPIGLFMRLIRRDVLALRLDRFSATYWCSVAH